MKKITTAMRSLFSIVLVFGLITVGCKSVSSEKEGEATEHSDEMVSKEEIEKSVEQLINSLPSPFGLAEMLNEIGAVYVGENLNPTDNVSNYFTEKSKALNLGAYGTDLGYTTIYEKNQETRAYFKSVKELLDELKVDVDYEYLIDENQKERLENKDTAVAIITNTFYDVYDFLNKNNSPELSVLMAAGSWIEGLYIATHISEDTYDNLEMVKIIYDQSTSLDSLLVLMSEFEADEDIKEIKTDLDELKVLYQATEGSLTQEDLNTLKEKIKALRTSIVS
jgi:hypothetical protein